MSYRRLSQTTHNHYGLFFIQKVPNENIPNETIASAVWAPGAPPKAWPINLAQNLKANPVPNPSPYPSPDHQSTAIIPIGEKKRPSFKVKFEGTLCQWERPKILKFRRIFLAIGPENMSPMKKLPLNRP
jgi:hypothetical protein